MFPNYFSVSEVRIVLLGENVASTTSVRNVLLGRPAFEPEVLSSVKLHSERASNHIEGRIVTIINTSHLFNPHLSQEELTHRVKECISLAAPAPYVFLLVLQPKLTKNNQLHKVRSVLETYSPLSRKRSIVLTVGEDHGFISECEVRHYRMESISTFNTHQVLQLLKKIDILVKETGGSDLQERKDSETMRRLQDHFTEDPEERDGDGAMEELQENKGNYVIYGLK